MPILPRKRTGVGCLLFDNAGRLLIVNPTYKPGWSIPGGAVDANESPHQACRRELIEELGIDVILGPLLCVDYVAADGKSTENIQFLFAANTVDATMAAQIALPPQELSEWRFEDPPAAVSQLRPKLEKGKPWSGNALTRAFGGQ